ncbi:Tetratricopeptide repeat protein [Gammaproteobacteria bacterium]
MTEKAMIELFLSHADDTAFVQTLRQRLKEYEIAVTPGGRERARGLFPSRANRSAIAGATCFAVVLDSDNGNFRQVRREIALAREIARSREKSFQPVVLVPNKGFNSASWFDPDDSPQILTMENNHPEALDTLLPELIAALGHCQPDGPCLSVFDKNPFIQEKELRLTLYNPNVVLIDGRERLCAEASVAYFPAGLSLLAGARDNDQQRRFRFMAPLEPIEADELNWYLDNYQHWPVGEFQRRAQVVEATLSRWGQALYRTALGCESARAAREAWRRATGDRRFSILVDTSSPGITDKTKGRIRRPGMSSRRTSSQAMVANDFLALPWELLHDGRGYLFQDTRPITIAKLAHDHLSGNEERTSAIDPPVRILLVCPRPEDVNIPYLDHRRMAQPLIQVAVDMGGLVQLTLLAPPTLSELEKTLDKARRRRTPYTVVHFDGYGIHDRHHSREIFCFEDPASLERLEGRREKFVESDELAALLREYRIPVVFLTVARWTHREEPQRDPASVPGATDKTTTALALRLLRAGLKTVVALTHHVPTSTAARFLAAFHSALAQGERVGTATAKGQQALRDDPHRVKVMGMSGDHAVADLSLIDWFVPVLYQDTQDFQIFRRLAGTRLAALRAEQRQPILDALPRPPHGFHGRSREMLALERRLLIASYAVITGPNGIGKTALAVETARWLVESGRFERAAFVSLEDHPHPRAVLDCLGRQLVVGWDDGVVVTMTDSQSQQQVERALMEQSTLILLDNASIRLVQSPADSGETCLNATLSLQTILDLCRVLQRASLTTRLLFTSHEALPPPYTGHAHSLSILEENDAIALLAGILHAAGLAPVATDPGRSQQELLNLIQAMNCHPRALMLIAPELARYGVRATTAKLRAILADLHRVLPDQENTQTRAIHAAIGLSLRALPAESQTWVRVFAHFQGVASLDTVAAMLNLTPEQVAAFADQMIGVRLAHGLADGCLALDPALQSYLKAVIDERTRGEDWGRWVTATVKQLNTLYKNWFRNANRSLRLTRRELPNLLTLLDWSAAHQSAEDALGLVWRLETLLAPLRLPRVLERVTALRERLAPRFVGWGRAAFTAEAEAVERLLESGWLPEALGQAQALVGRFENAGDKAYPGAAYDQAMAHRLLGRVMEASGTPAPALAYLELARRRFQVLAEGGSAAAARMASACCTERGDCLRAQGQLEAAAAAYQEALMADEARGARRDAAVNRLQLADIWRLQGSYLEALSLYAKARESFTELCELSMVAIAWHQMALIHHELGDWQATENAYQEVLSIWVRRNDLNGEALTLMELADFYLSRNQNDQAAACYRQAAERQAILGNSFQEGQARFRLANTLVESENFAAARQEIERALSCQTSHGHGAESWKTWALLENIERRQNCQPAAIKARNEAAVAYLAYRREGGEALFAGGRLCEQVAMIMAQGARSIALLERLRTATLQSNLRSELHALLPRLLAIIAGSRDPTMANDPDLHYSDSAELRLLLERLG